MQKFAHLHSIESRGCKMSRSSVVFAVAIILQVSGVILATEEDAGEVKPCSDFLSYACKLRKGRMYKSIKMDELLDNYIFKDKEINDDENKFYKFRQHCTQTNMEDKKNFLKKFNSLAGGWPALNKSWKGDIFDLQIAIAELQSFNLPAVFMVELSNWISHYSMNVLRVRPHIEDKLFDDDYEQLVKRKLLGVIDDDDVDEVINDSRKVVALLVAEKNSTREYIRTDYKGLKQKIPEIDWDKQFETMYSQKVPDFFEVGIDQFGLLKRIIRKMFEVEPKVMANYLFYRVVYFLPDLDKYLSKQVLEDVTYNMVIKHYTNETKQELRGMLLSLLKTLGNTTNLFGNEDTNIENAINEFVIDEVLPNIDDFYFDYFDNTYGNTTPTEGNCYSTVAKMIHKNRKSQCKIYCKRIEDRLRSMRSSLKYNLMQSLPLILDESSAIHFEIVFWSPLELCIFDYRDTGRYRDIGRFTPMQQCLENQIGEELGYRGIREALKIKIFTKAYFDWAEDNADMMQQEESKYNESSKKVFLERLIARYCDYDRNSAYNLPKSLASGIFGNLKEVAEAYNCPVGSRFNRQFTCEFDMCDIFSFPTMVRTDWCSSCVSSKLLKIQHVKLIWAIVLVFCILLV